MIRLTLLILILCLWGCDESPAQRVLNCCNGVACQYAAECPKLIEKILADKTLQPEDKK